jgi:hypothetical protein
MNTLHITVENEGWTKAIREARLFLSQFPKEVNRSRHFGDSEVYYINNNNEKVNEGYLSSYYNYNGDISNITVNGVEFIGRDAREVMK